MAYDAKTRKLPAVRKRKASPVANLPTRRVQAVRKKSAPVALGLLPEAALESKTFRFVESRGFFKSDFTTDTYEVQLADRTPILRAPRQLSLIPGWKFELRDLDGGLRFTLSLGLGRLLQRNLSVEAPDGHVLARFEPRHTLMEVKYEVFDEGASPRFELYQPADVQTSYTLFEQGFPVARVSKDKGPPVKNFLTLDNFVDAFRVDLESALLDERDRVICIAAALFTDRVFFTGDQE